MRYQRIHSQIWQDEKFTKLSEDARMLFIYILTCPHGNIVGIFVLPKQYIACDLGWELKRLAKPFNELLREQLIFYDEAVKLVCIKNHLKHNPLENRNQVIAATKNMAQLPSSVIYQTLTEQLRKRYHEPLRKLLQERYAKPMSVAG